jgi:hypothetical protein
LKVAQRQAEEAHKQAARIGISPADKSKAESDAALKEIERKAKEDELIELIRRTNGNINMPGRFEFGGSYLVSGRTLAGWSIGLVGFEVVISRNWNVAKYVPTSRFCGWALLRANGKSN